MLNIINKNSLIVNNKNNLLKYIIYQKRYLHDANRMLELVLVRHGESEGNVAYRRSKKGDHSLYDGEFQKRHSSKWRLTNRGRLQAEKAGEWLQNNFHNNFDRYFVSEYLRAMETAARLGYNDINNKWYSEVFLRERDWGQLDLMSWESRQTKMGDELKRRDLDRFLWSPPGGESLADVGLRVDRFIAQQHNECKNKRVIVVCHGEVMWAMRQRIERMSLDRYNDLASSMRLSDHLHNGQILWYTRIHPETGEISGRFTHLFSVCPWNLSLSKNRWEEIERVSYDNDTLLAKAQLVPRMISDMPSDIINSKKQHIPINDYIDIYDGNISDDINDENNNINDDNKNDTLYKTKMNSTLPDDPTIRRTGQPYKKWDKLNIDEPSIWIHPKPLNNLENVLIVAKRTRYDALSEAYNKTGEELNRQLRLRGIGYERLLNSSIAHKKALENIDISLKSHGSKIDTISSRSNLKEQDFTKYDLVIAAGGDGTFLRAASLLPGHVPILGVNTDPAFSDGYLCTCHLDMSGSITENTGFRRIVKRIINDEYTWKNHRRLIGKLISPNGDENSLPQYILNEIFIAEKDPSRPSLLNIGLDNYEREVIRSSGIIISSGTGSSAWFRSATQINPEVVKTILLQLDENLDPSLIKSICEELKNRFDFAIESNKLGFVIREPILNKSDKCSRQFGFGKSMSVKNFGWKGQLTIDGVSNIDFSFGDEIRIEVGNTIDDMLHAIHIYDDYSKTQSEEILH